MLKVAFKTPKFWLSLGSLLAFGATALYFGSDDWPRAARLLGRGVVWLAYWLGLGVLGFGLTRCARRFLGRVALILGLGLAGLIYCHYTILPWQAYLLTHPYALYKYGWSAQSVDARLINDWGTFVLTPYQVLLGITLLWLLLACGVVAGGQGLRQQQIAPLWLRGLVILGRLALLGLGVLLIGMFLVSWGA